MPSKKSRYPRWTGSRFRGPGFDSYTTAIGQLVLAWNDLHDKLAVLFALIASEDSRPRDVTKHLEWGVRAMEKYAGLWESVIADGAKRKMYRSLLIPEVTADFKRYPTFLEDMTWVLDKVGTDLEPIRNNAVHTPLTVGTFHKTKGMEQTYTAMVNNEFGVMPNVRMKNRKALQSAKKDHAKKQMLQEFRKCRADLLALRDFCVRAMWALIAEDSPWPDRPSLLTRAEQSAPRAGQPHPRPK